MLSTSRIISLMLAGQWFLASQLVSARQRAVAYSNAKISRGVSYSGTTFWARISRSSDLRRCI
jgi:hypothetical protein